MADKIVFQRKWIQHAGTIKEHFDICLSKKSAALAAGAVAITYPDGVAEIMKKRRAASKG
ncbi:DUF4031 domain-containing protein [Pseudomonas aeruginosa]|uniref:DUF4031 domain-containing protein n=1 Tax=Pseudomonas aeruginosa TaxID=287 RepID=UPI000E022D79|nr:DUF4031 domain-containing protein [Pseudomonas aeruginosa]SUD81163.1 Uncharacterised protein [Pseudomonas aeruginosa]